MAVVDSETINSGSELLKQWGQLGDAALIGAVILGLAVVIAIVIYIVFQYKKARMEQSAKDKRSQDYVESNNKVAVKLDKMAKSITDSYNESTKTITESLKNINDSLNSLKTSTDIYSNHNIDFKKLLISAIDKMDVISIVIHNILDKTRGVMSLKDSIYLIKLYFMKLIYQEIERSVHESLKENDFVNRTEYVTNKVRTNIGVILSNYRTDLGEFELPFNVSKFFKLDSASTSERFMLVDLIWLSIVDIFRSNKNLQEKKEEASLKISNVISDYVSEILNQEDIDSSTTKNYSKIKSNH